MHNQEYWQEGQGQVNRVIRALYKRLGIIHVGRRRVRDLIDFIEDREIDVVIDVGANIGQFGESLRADGYRGRIISFEPIESAFQTLSRKALADGNWEAHHCGLGAASGSATLHVSELSVFSSILDLTSVAGLHDSRIAVDHTEEIPIRTLDQVAAELSGKILLKIDTQGYEKHVIGGGGADNPASYGDFDGTARHSRLCGRMGVPRSAEVYVRCRLRSRANSGGGLSRQGQCIGG